MVSVLSDVGNLLYMSIMVFFTLHNINYLAVCIVYLKCRRKKTQEEQTVIENFYHQLTDEDLPHILSQIPVYNDRHVIKRAIDALTRIDYPKDKHTIQILDDSTNDTSNIIAATVVEYVNQGFKIQHIQRDNRDGFKAGALKNGMDHCDAEFILIFDSDFVPAADFHKKMLAYILHDKKMAFVQARWSFLNTNASLLTRAQALTFDMWHLVLQPVLSWLGYPGHFCGTAGIWRRQAILDAGHWSGDTLTEDADLGYRAQMLGYRCKHLVSICCDNELVNNVKQYTNQQYRWTKGVTQVSVKLFKGLIKSQLSLINKVQTIFKLTGYMAYPLNLFLGLIAMPLASCIHSHSHWVWRSSVYFILAVFSLFVRQVLMIISQLSVPKSLKDRLYALPLTFILPAGLSISNSRAVISALLGRKSPFVVTQKTGEKDASLDVAKEKVRTSKKWYQDNPLIVIEAIFSCYLLISAAYLWEKHWYLGTFYLFVFGIEMLSYVAISLSEYRRRIAIEDSMLLGQA